MTKRTVADRVKEYTERQKRDRGMVRVTVWVPIDRTEAIRQQAAYYREEAREVLECSGAKET